jgi:hypothetical protein
VIWLQLLSSLTPLLSLALLMLVFALSKESPRMLPFTLPEFLSAASTVLLGMASVLYVLLQPLTMLMAVATPMLSMLL